MPINEAPNRTRPTCHRVQGARPMNRSIIALAAALMAGPAFADSPEYPPGLFEHSPVVPSGPSNGAPSARRDASAFGTAEWSAFGAARCSGSRDPEMQTFLLGRRTAAARPTTFALASNSALSAVWLKSGRRTLGAIRGRIDRAGVMADESTLSNVSEVNVTPQEPLDRIIGRLPAGNCSFRLNLGPRLDCCRLFITGGCFSS